MSDATSDGPELELEPERYELHASPGGARLELDRRDFLRVLGGGLLVLCLWPRGPGAGVGRAPAARPGRGRRPARSAPGCTSARTAR